MRRRIISIVTTLTLALGVSAQVAAETSAEDAVKYRQSVMTALKGHISAISMVVRDLAGDPSFLPKHATALAALGAELKTVFPEGSVVEDSNALPAIWQEREKFAEALARIESASATLGEVGAGGDMQAIGGALKEVGQACKGCHDDFRKEHEH